MNPNQTQTKHLKFKRYGTFWLSRGITRVIPLVVAIEQFELREPVASYGGVQLKGITLVLIAIIGYKFFKDLQDTVEDMDDGILKSSLSDSKETFLIAMILVALQVANNTLAQLNWVLGTLLVCKIGATFINAKHDQYKLEHKSILSKEKADV